MSVRMLLKGHKEISVGGETLKADENDVFVVPEDFVDNLRDAHGAVRLPHVEEKPTAASDEE